MENIQIHTNHTKRIDELSSSIFGVKNSIFDLISTDFLEKRKEEISAKLFQLHEQENTARASDMVLFKKGLLLPEEFKRNRLKIQSEIDKWEVEKQKIEYELRIREIIEHNKGVSVSDELTEIINNLGDYLGENIMNGGSNAKGVFNIPQKNLVVIEKSAGTFQYIGDLPYYYDQCIVSENIPKVLFVTIKDKKTYMVMERARGIQCDMLSIDFIESIPQKHFDELVETIYHLEAIGLAIDPSKRSNFFYDSEIGFVLIDLSIGKNQLTGELFKQNLIVALLGNTGLGSENFRKKLENAIQKKG